MWCSYAGRCPAALFVLALGSAHAQVTCLLCYDQNARVISGGTDLLANGGFEDPGGLLFAMICPNAAQYEADVPGWTCTGGGTATYATLTNESITWVPEGLNSLYLGNSYGTVCPGSTSASCLLPGCVAQGLSAGYPASADDFGGPTGVSVEQVVTGLVPGQAYVLEFWAGGEDLYAAEGLFAVDVGYGMHHLRCPPTPPQPGTIGRRFVLVFTANATAHTVRFTNWGHITAQSTEVVLDDIRLFAESDLPLPLACATTVPDAVDSRRTRLWPLPCAGVLYVERGDEDRTLFTLFDTAGRPLRRALFSGVAQLDVERLPPGIYTYTAVGAHGPAERGMLLKE